MKFMKSVPLLIILTLSTGILIGYLVNTPAPTPEIEAQKPQRAGADVINDDAVAFDRLSSRIADLEQRLVDEILIRHALEENLDKLNQKLAKLDQGATLNPNHNIAARSDENENTITTASASGWFKTQALIEIGISSSQAAELKSFFEQQELDRMYLRDQSVRENWGRQKYREELQKLSENADNYLSQLDETAYDAYLYASGQPNRIRVTSVLDSSQAGTAGIQPGDHILSYDNKRVYSGFELRSATSGGDINQTVAVEIERDGEIQTLYLNRGPLGVRMNSISIAPSS